MIETNPKLDLIHAFRLTKQGSTTDLQKIIHKIPSIINTIIDEDHMTMLHHACEGKFIYTADMLLQHHADINMKNSNGSTPLHLATQQECLDLIKLLLEYQAKINITDNLGKSPLHIACGLGSKDIIIFLKDAGCDGFLFDGNGKTPMDYIGDKSLNEDIYDLWINTPRLKADPVFGKYFSMSDLGMIQLFSVAVAMVDNSEVPTFQRALNVLAYGLDEFSLTRLLTKKQLQLDPILATLHVKDSDVWAQIAESVKETLGSDEVLLTLNLKEIFLGKEGASIVAEALASNSSLTDLNISTIGAGIDGGTAIAKALTTNSALKHLDISRNIICDDGAYQISGALLDNASLTALNLSDNLINDEGFFYIGEALMENSSLQSIDISNNVLRDEGMTSLCKAIVTRDVLTDLDVSGNTFGETGACLLADALQQSRHLSRLLLNHCQICKRGILAIAKALQGNCCLVELSLNGNTSIENSECTLAFCSALEKNKSLRLLSLSDCSISLSNAELLAETLRVNSVITSICVGYGLDFNLTRKPNVWMISESVLNSTSVRLVSGVIQARPGLLLAYSSDTAEQYAVVTPTSTGKTYEQDVHPIVVDALMNIHRNGFDVTALKFCAQSDSLCRPFPGDAGHAYESVRAVNDASLLDLFNFCFWKAFVQQKDFEPDICALIRQRPMLLEVADQSGLLLVNILSAQIGKEPSKNFALEQGNSSSVVLYKRYALLSIAALHHSTRSEIFAAVDGLSKDQNAVVLKFLLTSAELEQSVSKARRVALNPIYVVGIYCSSGNHQEVYDSHRNTTPSSSNFGYELIQPTATTKYPCCIVYPAAKFSLSDCILRGYFASHDSKANIASIRETIKSVFRSVHYLHSCGFVHCRIEPSHLLNFGKSWRLAGLKGLTAFGDADIDSGCVLIDKPSVYCPPEFFVHDRVTGKLSQKSEAVKHVFGGLAAHPSFDVWSLGVMLFDLLLHAHDNQCHQSHCLDLKSLPLSAIADWNLEILHAKLQCIPDYSARVLLFQMLHPDPSCRMRVEKLLCFPFFEQDCPTESPTAFDTQYTESLLEAPDMFAAEGTRQSTIGLIVDRFERVNAIKLNYKASFPVLFTMLPTILDDNHSVQSHDEANYMYLQSLCALFQLIAAGDTETVRQNIADIYNNSAYIYSLCEYCLDVPSTTPKGFETKDSNVIVRMIFLLRCVLELMLQCDDVRTLGLSLGFCSPVIPEKYCDIVDLIRESVSNHNPAHTSNPLGDGDTESSSKDCLQALSVVLNFNRDPISSTGKANLFAFKQNPDHPNSWVCRRCHTHLVATMKEMEQIYARHRFQASTGKLNQAEAVDDGSQSTLTVTIPLGARDTLDDESVSSTCSSSYSLAADGKEEAVGKKNLSVAAHTHRGSDNAGAASVDVLQRKATGIPQLLKRTSSFIPTAGVSLGRKVSGDLNCPQASPSAGDRPRDSSSSIGSMVDSCVDGRHQKRTSSISTVASEASVTSVPAVQSMVVISSNSIVAAEELVHPSQLKLNRKPTLLVDIRSKKSEISSSKSTNDYLLRTAASMTNRLCAPSPIALKTDKELHSRTKTSVDLGSHQLDRHLERQAAMYNQGHLRRVSSALIGEASTRSLKTDDVDAKRASIDISSINRRAYSSKVSRMSLTSNGNQQTSSSYPDLLRSIRVQRGSGDYLNLPEDVHTRRKSSTKSSDAHWYKAADESGSACGTISLSEKEFAQYATACNDNGTSENAVFQERPMPCMVPTAVQEIGPPETTLGSKIEEFLAKTNFLKRDDKPTLSLS